MPDDTAKAIADSGREVVDLRAFAFAKRLRRHLRDELARKLLDAFVDAELDRGES